MPSNWIIEGIDILSNGDLGLVPCFEHRAPDQLGFDGFEDGFHHGIIITIAFATHGQDEVVVFQELLIVSGTILGTAIRVVNDTLGRSADKNGAAQRRQRQIFLHAVADRPANDAQ